MSETLGWRLIPPTRKMASEAVSAIIAQIGGWRGSLLADVRTVILCVDPDIIEGWTWGDKPVWSRGGDLCTAEIYAHRVMLVFAKGRDLPDPHGLLSDGRGSGRAITWREGDHIRRDELRQLIGAAIALNRESERG